MSIQIHRPTEFVRKQDYVFGFSFTMCSIVRSVGCSQNTAGGEPTPPLCPLLASVNLRKYNHSLLPQLPAELQTQAVSHRALQTLQSVSDRGMMRRPSVHRHVVTSV